MLCRTAGQGGEYAAETGEEDLSQLPGATQLEPNLTYLPIFLCFAGQLGRGGEYAAETGEEDLSQLPDATQLEPNLTYLHIFMLCRTAGQYWRICGSNPGGGSLSAA
jgi:hypothetical protein